MRQKGWSRTFLFNLDLFRFASMKQSVNSEVLMWKQQQFKRNSLTFCEMSLFAFFAVSEMRR